MEYSRSSMLFDTSVRSTSARSTFWRMELSATAAADTAIAPAMNAAPTMRAWGCMEGDPFGRSNAGEATDASMRGSELPSALGLNQAGGEIAEAADGRCAARDIVFVGLAGTIDPEGAKTERCRAAGVPGVGRDEGDLVRPRGGPGAASFVDPRVRLEDPQRRDGEHGLQRVPDSGRPQSVFQHVRIAVGEGRHAQPLPLQCLQRAGDFGKGIQLLVCQQQPIAQSARCYAMCGEREIQRIFGQGAEAAIVAAQRPHPRIFELLLPPQARDRLRTRAKLFSFARDR